MHLNNRRHSLGKLLPLLALLAFAACTPARTPEVAPVAEFEVTQEFSIDTIDQVRDLSVDERGNIWVLSASPPFITILNPAGTVIASRGNRGRGPTDFVYPFQLVSVGDEEPRRFDVYDLGRSALLQLDTTQTPRAALPIRVVNGTMRSDITRLVGALPFAASRSSGEVLAVVVGRDVSNARDLSFQAVVRFGNGTVDTVWSNSALPATKTKWLISYPLWTACGRDGLAGVSADGTLLLRIPFRGAMRSEAIPVLALRKPISAEAQAIQVRNQMENEYFDNGTSASDSVLRRQVADVMSRTTQDPRDSLPLFASIRCTKDGAVWLQHFDVADSPLGLSRLWWRVEGQAYRAYRTPPNFQPYVFTDTSAVGIRTDGDQNMKLARISLRR